MELYKWQLYDNQKKLWSRCSWSYRCFKWHFHLLACTDVLKETWQWTSMNPQINHFSRCANYQCRFNVIDCVKSTSIYLSSKSICVLYKHVCLQKSWHTYESKCLCTCCTCIDRYLFESRAFSYLPDASSRVSRAWPRMVACTRCQPNKLGLRG